MNSFAIIENFNVFPNILLCLRTCCILLLINKFFSRHHGMIRYKRYLIITVPFSYSCYIVLHTVVIVFDNHGKYIDFLDQNDARPNLPIFDVRQTLLSDFHINNAILGKYGGHLWLLVLSVFVWGFWCDVSICNICLGITGHVFSTRY